MLKLRSLSLLLFFAAFAHADEIAFTPRELFRVPFGTEREALGTKVESGQLRLPGDFSMDAVGRFYINDRHKHRIARYSPIGAYEAGFQYPPTARQVFAHADERSNLWLLIADPTRGVHYGVYSALGKPLRTATFPQFNRYRLRVGDDSVLRAMLSSDKRPAESQLYRFDAETLLMKKESIAPPPETHHRVKKGDALFYVDQIPDASQGTPMNRITDSARRRTADITGTVVYVTDAGEIYTRVGAREIRVYGVNGKLRGKVVLSGLESTAASVRFNSHGDLFQLDGIPDSANQYSSEMPGMRMIVWERFER